MSPARGLADKRYTPRANRAGCKQKHTAVRRYGQLALPYAAWRPFSFKVIRMSKNIMLASENAKRMSNSELNNRSSWNGDDNVIGNGYRAKNDFENAHIGAVAIITVYSTELVSGDKVEHWKKIGKDEWIEIDAKTYCQLYDQYNGGKETHYFSGGSSQIRLSQSSNAQVATLQGCGATPGQQRLGVFHYKLIRL